MISPQPAASQVLVLYHRLPDHRRTPDITHRRSAVVLSRIYSVPDRCDGREPGKDDASVIHRGGCDGDSGGWGHQRVANGKSGTRRRSGLTHAEEHDGKGDPDYSDDVLFDVSPVSCVGCE